MAPNPINQIRRAFSIPESVTIIAATAIKGNVPRSQAKAESFEIDNTPIQDQQLYSSSLGTPVFADLEILGGSYETNVPGVVKTFEAIKFEAVLITVNQAKVIIKTQIQGRDGTVKEYIGMDDYEISINGVITGTNGVRPVDKIAALKKVTDAPISLDVVSAYLQALGINQITIDNCYFDQPEGSYAYQTFSINATSDEPQELRLTNV